MTPFTSLKSLAIRGLFKNERKTHITVHVIVWPSKCWLFCTLYSCFRFISMISLLSLMIFFPSSYWPLHGHVTEQTDDLALRTKEKKRRKMNRVKQKKRRRGNLYFALFKLEYYTWCCEFKMNHTINNISKATKTVLYLSTTYRAVQDSNFWVCAIFKQCLLGCSKKYQIKATNCTISETMDRVPQELIA